MSEVQQEPILDSSAFVAEPVVVEVPYQGGTKKLLVEELSYSQSQRAYGLAHKDKDGSVVDYLVAASVKDENGRRFTVEEVRHMKAAVAEPLVKKVLELEGLLTVDKDGKEVPKA